MSLTCWGLLFNLGVCWDIDLDLDMDQGLTILMVMCRSDHMDLLDTLLDLHLLLLFRKNDHGTVVPFAIMPCCNRIFINRGLNIFKLYITLCFDQSIHPGGKA